MLMFLHIKYPSLKLEFMGGQSFNILESNRFKCPVTKLFSLEAMFAVVTLLTLVSLFNAKFFLIETEQGGGEEAEASGQEGDDYFAEQVLQEGSGSLTDDGCVDVNGVEHAVGQRFPCPNGMEGCFCTCEGATRLHCVV